MLPPQPEFTEEWPSLSVVIPTIGREACLAAAVRDLGKQDYPNWECLIVFQGAVAASTPVALEAILGSKLRMFHAEEPNASLARNIGLREAKGDIVLFLDDDIEIRDRRFLAMHARHYQDRKISGVAGQILGPEASPRDDRHWISRLPQSGWLFFPRTYDKPTRIACGGAGNLSVRRVFALDVGGMDAQYDKGAYREESDFCLRLVRKYGLLAYDPEASLIHLGEPVGGCRSWGNNSGVHPLHHVTGEWYFILNGLKSGTIRWNSLPLHFYMLVRRQILNGQNAGASKIARACAVSARGFRAARRKLTAGPRGIRQLSCTAYRPVEGRVLR